MKNRNNETCNYLCVEFIEALEHYPGLIKPQFALEAPFLRH